ncbi:MAG TPA: DUF4041 domain-containing protein [Microvirga sp.]|nr:DUF4041 domain-containing protein [Microvirga sp.]
MEVTLALGAAAAVLFAIAAYFVILLIRQRKAHRAERVAFDAKIQSFGERLKPITSMDEEVARLQAEIRQHQSSIEGLRSSYYEKKAVYDRLIKEVAIFDEKLAFAEMGVYEPHFDFTDSEKYKDAIAAVREQQKLMVSLKTAVICTATWAVDGSASKGQTMTNRNIRLTLRAFNNECEAAIANTRWNNVNAMEKRITNAQVQIDKLNESNHIFITNDYLKLKLKELYLTHEYREKLKAEREEKAEAARAAREEQKFVRDLERAEEEEARYQRMLEKAKAAAAKSVGAQLEAYSGQVALLEKELEDAHAKVLRAQAMAEKTRSGYVYIISNVGSFGDEVIKIGLTRRLDPADRVRELGDASVPFVFDTHAIIYSDDAPALEKALHNAFEPTRVNARNYRKEFFRAKIDEVEAAVKRLAPGAPFFKDIEAQEYRETLAKRNATLLAMEARPVAFPAAI